MYGSEKVDLYYNYVALWTFNNNNKVQEDNSDWVIWLYWQI